MTDQIAELQSLKIPATFINGDLIQTEKAARYELLEQNTLKFLYLTPERFDTTVIRDPKEVERLTRITLVVLPRTFDNKGKYHALYHCRCHANFVAAWDDYFIHYGRFYSHSLSDRYCGCFA